MTSDAPESYRFIPSREGLEELFLRYEEERRRAGVATTLTRVSPQQRIDSIVAMLGLNADGGWRRSGMESPEDLWLRYLMPVLAETRESALALATAARAGLPGAFEPPLSPPPQEPEQGVVALLDDWDPPPRTWRDNLALWLESLRELIEALGTLRVGLAATFVTVIAVSGLVWWLGKTPVPAVPSPAPVQHVEVSHQTPTAETVSKSGTPIDAAGIAYRAAIKVTLEALQQHNQEITPRQLAEIYAGESAEIVDPAVFLATMFRDWPLPPDMPIPHDRQGAFALTRYAETFAALEQHDTLDLVRPALDMNSDQDDAQRKALLAFSATPEPTVASSSAADAKSWWSWLLERQWLVMLLPAIAVFFLSRRAGLRAFKAQLTNPNLGARGAMAQLPARKLILTALAPARRLVRQISWREPGLARRLNRAQVLITSALIIVPLTVGYFVQSYVGASQRQLDDYIGPDQVTALRWGSGPQPRLYVGTKTGHVLVFDSSGKVLPDLSQDLGEPVEMLYPPAGSDPEPLAATFADRQLSNASPPGDLGQNLPFGAETCKSGFVWRATTASDLVCVTPDSRDQAARENAITPTGFATPFGTAFVPCDIGLVPRKAFPEDHACVSAQRAADIAKENRLDEQNTVLPDAAHTANRRLALKGVEAEDGLIAVAGTTVVSDTLLAASGQAAQLTLAEWEASALPDTADQAMISDNAALFRPHGVRGLIALPGKSVVIAATDDNGIMAVGTGVRAPSVVALGFHAAGIVGMAAASAPLPGAPQLATASSDGVVKVWRIGPTVPSSADASGADVRAVGSTWTRVTYGGAVTALDAVSGSPGDNVVATDLTGRKIVVERTFDLAHRLTTQSFSLTAQGPISRSDDGGLFAYYNRAKGQVRVTLYNSTDAFDSVEILTFRPAATPVYFAFSPAQFSRSDISIIAIEADGSLETKSVFDIGPLKRVTLSSSAKSIAFSPDGQQIAVGLEGGGAVVGPASGDNLSPIATDVADAAALKLPATSSFTVGFSPSGRSLILFNRDSQKLYAYAIRAQRLEPIASPLPNTSIAAAPVSFSPRPTATT